MGKTTISDDKKVVVKSLVDAGTTYRKINEITGVSLGLITKIVKEFESSQELIEWYKKNKINVLMKAQLDNLALQEAIRQSITKEQLKNWTPDQKARWYQVLGTDHGIRGQSTENVSVIIEQIKEIKKRRMEESRKQE